MAIECSINGFHSKLRGLEWMIVDEKMATPTVSALVK